MTDWALAAGMLGVCIALALAARWLAARGFVRVTRPVDVIDPPDEDGRCERGRVIDVCAHVCERYGVHILALPPDRPTAARICRTVLTYLEGQAHEILDPAATSDGRD